MAQSSPFSATLNRLLKGLTPATKSLTGSIPPLSRTYHKAGNPKGKISNLFSRIIPLGDPATHLGPVIDQWVSDGKRVTDSLLVAIIKGLRARRRYTHALEVSEWMSCKWSRNFSASDHAVQLDLIGRVRGVESAEAYFDNLNLRDKNDKTYGALLHCYAKYGLVEKSLSLLEKMKLLGYASSYLVYKDLMFLYANASQPEKVFKVFMEMKKNGIAPDNFSYRLCLNSYRERCGLVDAQRIAEEMESDPEFSMDWITCSTMANIYIKAGSEDMALVYLKKCEEKIDKEATGYNHLISLYANLGNKDEVMRVWSLAKSTFKIQNNRDYITMLGSLVKLDALEEAKKLLSEWQSTCQFHDFRVPNVLLIGYTQKGQVEKAEALLLDIIAKGKTPIPNSWSIIAAGYADSQNMEGAYRCMKEALDVQTENKGWSPKPQLISRIFDWLAANGDTEQAQSFVTQLKSKLPKIGEMYDPLLETYLRSQREVDGVIASSTRPLHKAVL